MELKKYGQQIVEVDILDLSVHKVASINPSMTDVDFQELKTSLNDYGYDKNFPILLYKKKIVDGRHRFIACGELGIDRLWARHLPQNMTMKEVEELVIRTDNRRHKTPTQKAIGAYRYYLERMATGNKLSQEAVAEKFGTSKLMMSRVPKLEKVAGSDRIDALFNGKKLTIENKDGKPLATDALLTLIGFYQNNAEEDIVGYSKASDNFSDDESSMIDTLFNQVSLSCSASMLESLNKRIWNEINRKTGR